MELDPGINVRFRQVGQGAATSQRESNVYISNYGRRIKYDVGSKRRTSSERDVTSVVRPYCSNERRCCIVVESKLMTDKEPVDIPIVLQMQGLLDPFPPYSGLVESFRSRRRGRKRVSDNVRQSRFFNVGEGRIRAAGLTRGSCVCCRAW